MAGKIINFGSKGCFELYKLDLLQHLAIHPKHVNETINQRTLDILLPKRSDLDD
jgi:hypothetical protein